MRSTTFALLGATALFGLAIVAIMSQQGWPLLPSLPLPSAAIEREALDRASVVAPSGSAAAAGVHRAVDAAPAPPPTDGAADAAEPSGSRLAGSQHLDPAPVPNPAAAQPTGQDSPEPASVPVPASAPAPPASTLPVSTPSSPPAVDPAPSTQASTAGSTDHGKGNGYGKYKSHSDSGKAYHSGPHGSALPSRGSPTKHSVSPGATGPASPSVEAPEEPDYSYDHGHGYDSGYGDDDHGHGHGHHWR